MLNANKQTIDQLLEIVEKQNEALASARKESQQANNRIKELEDIVNKLRRQLYGKKTERLKAKQVDDGQMTLFDMPTDEVIQEDTPPTETEHITYTRKKRPKGKKEAYYEDLPILKTVQQTLSKEDCVCDHCQSELRAFGVAKSTREIVRTPAKFGVIVYEQLSYRCDHCSKHEAQETVKKARPYRLPLYNSICSATLAAYVITQKFQYYLPLYRIEQMWNKDEFYVSRNTLANWLIQLAELYIKPLVMAMEAFLLSEPVIHIDETTYRVNKGDANTYYIWGYASHERSEHPVIFFECQPTRSRTVPLNRLQGYQGYIQTDGYAAYRQLPGCTQVGCWAHVRRGFFEAKGTQGVNSKAAEKALTMIGALFAEDEKIQLACQGDSAAIKAQRQISLLPTYEAFKAYIDEISCRVALGSQLNKAIVYYMNHRESLERIFEDGRLSLSNNLAERAIRPIVMGRKNWLFSDSKAGGESNALYHSLIQTAKANGLDPEKYLVYLLTKMPNDPGYTEEHRIEAYLPWNPDVQAQCAINESKETVSS